MILFIAAIWLVTDYQIFHDGSYGVDIARIWDGNN